MDQETCENVVEISDIKQQRTENVVKGWENLDTDVLMRIFQNHFSIDELTSGLAHVCRGWRAVCCDPVLWDTLDLSHMKSVFIKTNNEPYVYVERRSDEYLTRILKLSMSLSKGNTRTLIFHYNLFLTDDMLTYTAERYIHFLVLYISPSNTYFGIFISPFNRSIISSTHLIVGVQT